MKIWCFSCFDCKEEEEEEIRSGRRMREEEAKSDDDREEEEEPEGSLLGFNDNGNPRERDEGGEPGFTIENFLSIDDQFGLSRGGQGGGNAMDVNLSLGLGEEPSSSSAALDHSNDECDGDSRNKRPKVESFARDWERRFAPATSSDANIYKYETTDYSTKECGLRSETLYLSPLFNCGVDQNPYNSIIERDGGDGCEISETEDLEVQMDLTDDLLHMVFSFLKSNDLCRTSMVCRQWRAASVHEDFWRFLDFEDRNISVEQFEDMCHRYPNAISVNIYGTPALPVLVMKAVCALRNLGDITLGKGQLGENFFQALTDCQLLKSLVIIDATLGNGIQEIPIYHDRLRQLQIVKCRVLRVTVRCPQLETLSLKRSSMAHAVLNCPLLRDLDIASCHKFSDAAIRSAATSCPLLESLDMSNCSCVTDETLREIALTCANLHVLDASYCPNIALESVRLPMLTVLKLHSCEGITSASMTAVSHSYMLEVLELDNCSSLQSVSLDLPRLQNIRLVHCRKSSDLNLQSIKLSSITVSNCPLLQRINITSNSLLKLVLQKQEKLSTLTLQCQCLQEVDLAGCESLTNSICDVFCDGGACPMLKSLVLDHCESLTAVGFRSTSLVSLSLAGCRAVTSLELICPYLENVSLDGCDHLERASFCPVGLQSLNLGICPKLSVLHIEAPQMLLLELKGCGVLSEASINCPLLTSLDASFCSQLKDECLSATATSCQLIGSLILMSCPSVGPDGLSSLHRLPHLTSLDLSYTFLTNLQPVFESCLQLKVLKLQACKYLADSSLEPLYKEGALPALCELELSYGTLCQSAIEELLAYCTRLTHVSLNGYANMHDLNWGCSSNQLSELPSSDGSVDFYSQDQVIPFPVEQPNRLLQNLNCVCCPNIKKVVIPQVARCFHLSSLNLSLSANLREVDIACVNLCFLNLSNCNSLEILKLKCPRLSSLFLQSCNIDEETLEAAISQCNMLETLDVRYCPKICTVSMGRLRAACPSLKRIFSSLSPHDGQ
ncbi:F-box/LRR-repeat protein 15 [Rhododendron vialii]|uniref:F-box/LRR-repeat protein 15 n=1 Tax=Rhododendron vialii TaxID=182163 RepID=UPI00265F7869|nr:F-box/LRR-repeat protein 15 [Rhododendron vialii]XP_058204419.1 F-box/LRR-repeat protein 15 [Rhododendron vialii]